MNMRKFLVSALVLVVAALAFTACGSCATADGTAYAAGNEFYICISPTDDTLAANETALPSSVMAVSDYDELPAFYLTQGYYYSLIRYSDVYALADFDAYYIYGGVDESALLTSLPDGATTSDMVPDVTLTFRSGVTLRLPNNITISASDMKGYTLNFVGFADASTNGTGNIVVAAYDGIRPTQYATISVSDVEEFSVPWHPIAAERRAELLAPDEPADDGTADGDLTGGTPSNALRIILIIGIAVPALLIVFLLFKPSSKRNDTRRTTMRRQDTERGIDYDRERSYESDRERYERGYRDYERRDYPENRGYGGYDRDDDRRY